MLKPFFFLRNFKLKNLIQKLVIQKGYHTNLKATYAVVPKIGLAHGLLAA